MDDELAHLLRDRDRDDIEKVLELLRSLHTKRHNGTPGVRNAGHNLARPLVEEADDNDLPLTQLGIPIQERFRTAAESRANGMPEESSAECASLTRAPMPNALTDSVVLAQLTGGVDGSPRKDSRTKKSAPKKDITPAHSLTSFGFFSSAVKAQEGNKLFSPFIQDKRIVPQSLQFWEVDRVDEEGTPIQHDPVDLLSVDEESSLMHPPIHPVEENEVVPITAQRKCSSFNEAIEASMKKSSNVYDAVQAAQCPCAYHSTIANPYDCFDGEVIFCGFYAVGYDPCQARPPYYGTFNHREGETTIDEVVATGRPACGVAVRRFAHVDYDYDSGDDWDVLEGDEDIAASSSGDSESHDDDSLDSSDDDFINDSNDGSDSDCEVQRKTMEARQRRMSRLRGKDKLLPSFSGPFTGIASEAHPLRFYDRLDRLAPLDGAFFDQVLQAELNPLSCPDSADAPDFNLMDNNCDAKVMEAALKNRRQMTDYEISAMKLIINNNSNISVKMVVKALQQQQMCIGVPLMVATRTIKRFFERRHGMLIERAEPWAVDDDRLFKKRKTTELGVPSQATLDFDADDENNTPTNCVSSSSAAAPAAVVEGMDAVCSEGNALNAMGETIEIGVKRPRDSPDDHDGG